MAAETRIWLLLGERRGDNNQVLALAEALGLPFETRQLRFNALHRLPLRLLGGTLTTLRPESRRALEGDLPDLVIAVGRRSVPVVRALRARSQGCIRAVHLGYPRTSPRHFDLVITTPQYPVPAAANVLRLPVGLGRPADETPRHWATDELFKQLRPPRRLLLLGGPTLFWTLDPEDVGDAIVLLRGKSEANDGSLLILPSPRTPPLVLRAAHLALGGSTERATILPMEGPPSYAELLEGADDIFVTADSVSMISEAIRSGKPVGIVPVRSTRSGRLWMALMDRLRPGRAAFPRDLRRFWAEIERLGLAGTVEAPRSGIVPDALGEAVAAVRRLLERPVPPATDGRDGDRPG